MAKTQTAINDIRQSLDDVEPRPANNAEQQAKRQYAERFSHALARQIADLLRPKFPGVFPDAGGTGVESAAGTSTGSKKLDVNFSNPQLGLALGVSIKTNNIRDKNGKGRYTKNFKRVDEEFLAEAMAYHVRQPYAVLVALYFMPFDSCDDGKSSGASSFGAFVRYFRRRAARVDPETRPELFERMFVGLYEHQEPFRGKVNFFNVQHAPPKQGRPPDEAFLTLQGLRSAIELAYDERNDPPFQWGK